MTMEYNFLGNTGLKVSQIGFGTFIYGVQVDEKVGIELIKKAFESGINFFDTAEIYGNGKSEEIVGKAFKELGVRRSAYVLSTKLFWAPIAKGEKRSVNEVGLSRKHIIEGLQGSLKRLDLDYVDVVFCHRPDKFTPIEEIVRAFDYVINKGMALYWGTSEWSADQITRAIISHRLGLIGPVVEQPQYNSIHRSKVEIEFAYLYESDKLGLTIWSPLSSGVLSGKYINGIPKGSRLDLPGMEGLLKGIILDDSPFKTLDELNNALKELKKISDKLGCSLSLLNLAWVLKNKNVNVMLLGATKKEQLEEDLKCLEILPKLTDEIMKEIDDILKTRPEDIFDFRKFHDS